MARLRLYEVLAGGHRTRMRYRTRAEAEKEAERQAEYRPKDREPMTVHEFTPKSVPDWQCRECKGLNIDGTSWIDLFDGQITDSEPPNDDVYCNDCEEHTGTEDFEADPSAGAPFPEALNG